MIGRDNANTILDALIEASEMTELQRMIHTWPGSGHSGGYTGLCMMEESHISVHTWPENHFVSVDVYSCTGNLDDPRLLETCRTFFAGRPMTHGFFRGYLENTDQTRLYTFDRVLIQKTTAKGVEIVIADTAEKGITLFLNGERQSSALDAEVYHKAMVEPALDVCRRSIRNVLVAGCGEGTVLPYLSAIPTLERVDHVDHDREVVEACKQYLPYQGYQEPALPYHYHEAEIESWIEGVEDGSYDLVLWDLPELSPAAAFLYDQDLLQQVARKMSPDAVISIETGSPSLWSAEPVIEVTRRVSRIYPQWFLLTVPELPWCWTIGTTRHFVDGARPSWWSRSIPPLTLAEHLPQQGRMEWRGYRS